MTASIETPRGELTLRTLAMPADTNENGGAMAGRRPRIHSPRRKCQRCLRKKV
jgi:hypothetical protein